ncbi:MAG: DUF4250 domain-containing protein [Clostridiales bacterium]|nr:DUF4250 domain-containing protein [Clostridiales bacterium]
MLPKDPVMLLSYVNTKLRDEYSSLESLCYDCGVSQEEIIDSLEEINYIYDEKLNKFV